MDKKFEEYKCLLKKHKYPNIMIMNDADIKEIFTKKNRPAFLRWVYDKIRFLIDGKDFAQIKTEDFLTSLKICSESQVAMFLEGTLEPAEQVKFIILLKNHKFMTTFTVYDI